MTNSGEAVTPFLAALVAVMRERRSGRAYLPERIPDSVLEACFDLAMLAPTSHNLECWQMIDVRDTNRLAALRHLCLDQPAAATAPHLIVAVARPDLWRRGRALMLEHIQQEKADPTLPDGSGFDWVFVFFRLIGLIVIVPVMEELFWRSFLLRWLDRHDFLTYDPRKVSVRAMLLCAVLFASEHNLWFAGLLAGLVYGLVYVRSSNLWLPIVSHATTNAALAWWILATGHWQFW